MRRVLGKLEGVRGVEIDVATKKVVVATDPALSAQTVFDTVAKTGSGPATMGMGCPRFIPSQSHGRGTDLGRHTRIAHARCSRL